MDVIRKAALNALLHQDYNIYTEVAAIQIDFFADVAGYTCLPRKPYAASLLFCAGEYSILCLTTQWA